MSTVSPEIAPAGPEGSGLDSLRALIRHRDLVERLALRDIRSRFTGSYAGTLWSVLHPLVLFGVYFLVFVRILRLRPPGYPEPGDFALYLMAGLFPWMSLSESLGRGMTSLLESSALIQKSAFRTEVLPAKAVLSTTLMGMASFVVLAIAVAILKGNLVALVFVPVLAALQALFALGAALLLSVAVLYVRDLLQVVPILLNFWTYLTPIIYPVDSLPPWGRSLMLANPAYPFVGLWQEAFLHGRLDPRLLFMGAGWALLTLWAGAALFSRTRADFADWL